MYSFDDSRRPLYITRMSGRLTTEDMVSMERDTLAMLGTAAPYCTIWDLTELEFPSREVISMGMKMSTRTTAMWRKNYDEPTDPPPNYTAYAMGARLTKLLRFYYRLPARAMQTPPIFATFEQALAAAEQECQKLGIPLPRAQQ